MSVCKQGKVEVVGWGKDYLWEGCLTALAKAMVENCYWALNFSVILAYD